MNVDDAYLVLHHHWVLDTSVFPDERQRLQFALLLLIQAYTASRPGALVYRKKFTQKEHYLGEEADGGSNNAMVYLEPADPEELTLEDMRTLCYEDVTLLLLPNPEGERDALAMEVTLKYTKGWEKRPNP
jgi:hypothetical protein